MGTTWVNNRGLVKTTEAVVGDEIAIYADIKNLDNLFDSNLDRINISLYVDNKYYSSKIQNLIGIYESSYGLNFTWIAKPGVHNLTIIIDPNNAINESDESTIT